LLPNLEDDSVGEVLLFGGAAIALRYGEQATTKDIDAVFNGFDSEDAIARAISATAAENNLEADWLNDAGKKFVTKAILHDKEELFRLKGVTFYIPAATALLAMKIAAMRLYSGSKDIDDIRLLLKVTGLSSLSDIAPIVSHYCSETDGAVMTDKLKLLALEELLKEQDNSLAQ
jgi:hypothetical protein